MVIKDIKIDKSSKWLWKAAFNSVTKNIEKETNILKRGSALFFEINNKKIPIYHSINKFNPDKDNVLMAIPPNKNWTISEKDRQKVKEKILELAIQYLLKKVRIAKKIGKLIIKCELKEKALKRKIDSNSRKTHQLKTKRYLNKRTKTRADKILKKLNIENQRLKKKINEFRAYNKKLISFEQGDLKDLIKLMDEIERLR